VELGRRQSQQNLAGCDAPRRARSVASGRRAPRAVAGMYARHGGMASETRQLFDQGAAGDTSTLNLLPVPKGWGELLACAFLKVRFSSLSLSGRTSGLRPHFAPCPAEHSLRSEPFPMNVSRAALLIAHRCLLPGRAGPSAGLFVVRRLPPR